MQQVAVLHFLHDKAVVTSRHADDIHRFMARRIETVTARKLAGAGLVVAGIFAVSLGKD